MTEGFEARRIVLGLRKDDKESETVWMEDTSIIHGVATTTGPPQKKRKRDASTVKHHSATSRIHHAYINRPNYQSMWLSG